MVAPFFPVLYPEVTSSGYQRPLLTSHQNHTDVSDILSHPPEQRPL